MSLRCTASQGELLIPVPIFIFLASLFLFFLFMIALAFARYGAGYRLDTLRAVLIGLASEYCSRKAIYDLPRDYARLL